MCCKLEETPDAAALCLSHNNNRKQIIKAQTKKDAAALVLSQSALKKIDMKNRLLARDNSNLCLLCQTHRSYMNNLVMIFSDSFFQIAVPDSCVQIGSTN